MAKSFIAGVYIRPFACLSPLTISFLNSSAANGFLCLSNRDGTDASFFNLENFKRSLVFICFVLVNFRFMKEFSLSNSLIFSLAASEFFLLGLGSSKTSLRFFLTIVGFTVSSLMPSQFGVSLPDLVEKIVKLFNHSNNLYYHLHSRYSRVVGSFVHRLCEFANRYLLLLLFTNCYVVTNF